MSRARSNRTNRPPSKRFKESVIKLICTQPGKRLDAPVEVGIIDFIIAKLNEVPSQQWRSNVGDVLELLAAEKKVEVIPNPDAKPGAVSKSSLIGVRWINGSHTQATVAIPTKELTPVFTEAPAIAVPPVTMAVPTIATEEPAVKTDSSKMTKAQLLNIVLSSLRHVAKENDGLIFGGTRKIMKGAVPTFTEGQLNALQLQLRDLGLTEVTKGGSNPTTRIDMTLPPITDANLENYRRGLPWETAPAIKPAPANTPQEQTMQPEPTEIDTAPTLQLPQGMHQISDEQLRLIAIKSQESADALAAANAQIEELTVQLDMETTRANDAEELASYAEKEVQDHNTVIREKQKEIDRLNAVVTQHEATIAATTAQLNTANKKLANEPDLVDAVLYRLLNPKPTEQ